MCSLELGEIRTHIPDAKGAAATKTPGVAGASWIFQIVHPVWRSTGGSASIGLKTGDLSRVDKEKWS